MEDKEAIGIAALFLGYQNALSIARLRISVDVLKDLLGELDPASDIIYQSRYTLAISENETIAFINQKIKDLEKQYNLNNYETENKPTDTCINTSR